MARALTLRNLPARVEREIVKRARSGHTSLNRAVIGLLEVAVDGLAPAGRDADPGDDLRSLAGSWSGEEAEAFDRSLRRQRRIEPDLFARR